MAIDPGYEGFGDLGSALLGGLDSGNIGQKAFNAGATQRATLESALATAHMKRDQLLARQKLRAAFPPGPEGDMMVAIMEAGQGREFNATAQGMGRLQQNTARQTAIDAPLPGTPGYTDDTASLVNQALASATGKLLSPSNVQVTQQAHSKIGVESERAATENARQAELGARTDANNALAAARRRPKTGAGSVPTSVDTPVDGDPHTGAEVAGGMSAAERAELVNARKAIGTGRITRDAARKRLYDAGMKSAAEQL